MKKENVSIFEFIIFDITWIAVSAVMIYREFFYNDIFAMNCFEIFVKIFACIFFSSACGILAYFLIKLIDKMIVG